MPLSLHFKRLLLVLGVLVSAINQVTAQLGSQTVLDKAEKLMNTAKYDSALAVYDFAAEQFSNQEKWTEYVDAKIGTASCNYYLAQFENTITEFKDAIEAAKKHLGSNYEKIGECQSGIGLSYSRLAKYDQATSFFKEALASQVEIFGEEHRDVAITLNNIGLNFSRQSMLDSALFYYQRSLLIRQKVLQADDPLLGTSYANLGVVYGKMGHYELQQEYYLKSLEVRINAYGEDHDAVARTYNNIAFNYGRLGDWNKQLIYYQESIAISARIFGEDHPNLATKYANISRCYLRQEDYEKSNHFLRKALAINLKKYGDEHPKVAENYSFLGVSNESNEAWEAAMTFYEKSLEIYQNLLGKDHPKSASLLSSISNCERELGNYSIAKVLLDSALTINLKAYGGKSLQAAANYLEMAELATAQENQSLALEFYQKSLTSLVREFDDTDVSRNPETMDIKAKLLGLRILSKKAKALFNLYEEEGQEMLVNALSTFDRALEVADALRLGIDSENSRQTITDGAMPAYEGAIATSIELYKTTSERKYLRAAFDYSEASKSFLLRMINQDSKARAFAGIPTELIDKEIGARRQIAVLEKRLENLRPTKDSVKRAEIHENIFQLTKEHTQLVETMERDYPIYFRSKFDMPTISASEIKEKLQNGNGLIEYFAGDEKVYGFALTNSETTFIEFERTPSFDELVADFRNVTADSELLHTNPEAAFEQYTKVGHDLFLLLVKPLTDSLGKLSGLTIVPDNVLHRINFEAILTEKVLGRESYKSLPYMLKNYQIDYAYSANYLNDLSKDRSTYKFRFAGFAPATGRLGDELDTVEHKMASLLFSRGETSLPGATEEVSKIASMLEGHSWLADDATETIFKSKAKDYKILHLATHGLIDDKNPDNIELLFSAKDSLNDGYLSVREIYNLELNADLVVLSACNTGYGELRQGEGNLSLSRAFSYAGCPSIVMSLWQVPDNATKSLMLDLYENINDDLGTSTSLRQSKLAYISSVDDPVHAHPYYWAAFVLTGETGSGKQAYPYILYLVAGLGVLLIFRRLKFRN